MKYSTSFQAAAVVLAVAVAAPLAAAERTAAGPMPTPAVMTDAAPLPAEDRSSVGAVVLEESPVLAQRETMQTTAGRPDTSVMGNTSSRASMRELRERMRAQTEAAMSSELRRLFQEGLKGQ